MGRSTLLLLLLAGSVWATTVQMVNTGTNALLGEPGYFLFNVDGTPRSLICDQFEPNVTTEPYLAYVSSLDDISNTFLISIAGLSQSEALSRYTRVAILDSLAYADPTNLELVAAVTWANRRIVDGAGILPGNPATPGTAAYLYDWVQTQNPANYDLSTFRIFTALKKWNGVDFVYFTQEQTGFEDPGSEIPEPRTYGLLAAGFGLIVLRRRLSASK